MAESYGFYGSLLSYLIAPHFSPLPWNSTSHFFSLTLHNALPPTTGQPVLFMAFIPAHCTTLLCWFILSLHVSMPQVTPQVSLPHHRLHISLFYAIHHRTHPSTPPSHTSRKQPFLSLLQLNTPPSMMLHFTPPSGTPFTPHLTTAYPLTSP